MKKRGPLWGNTTLLCHLRRPDPPVISPWQLFIRIHEQDLHAAHLSTDKDRWCDRDLAPAHSPGFNELFLNWLKHPSWLDQFGPCVRGRRRADLPRGAPWWNSTPINSEENKWFIIYQHTDLFGFSLPAAFSGDANFCSQRLRHRRISLPRGAPKFPVKITTTIKPQLIPGHLREWGWASGYSTPACKARSSLNQPGLQCQPARLLLRERTRRFSRRSRGSGGAGRGHLPSRQNEVAVSSPPAHSRWKPDHREGGA